MRLRAILLDMGGVLVPETSGYDGAAHDPELVAAFRELGADDPKEEIRARGEWLREAYRSLEAKCTQPDPDQVFADLEPALRARMLDAFRREAVQPAYPGVREVVADLAQAFRLGLVSNTVIPGDHHAHNLEGEGILEHIEAAVWSANFGLRKPDPAMLLHVLDQLGVRKDEAILVGDKIRTDVVAARRAEMAVVWLRCGDAPHTGEAEPDFVIRGLDELPELLRRQTLI